MDPYDLATFTTDLIVDTSYLRFITDCYDVFTAKFHDLLRVVTDNYDQLMVILRIVTSILRNAIIHRSFYVLLTTCLRVVTNSYELVTSIYESLRFFAKKYINPANVNVSSFDNKSYKKLLRVIYGFLRAVYGWLRVVACGLRYLRIVTSYFRKNQSVDNRQKIFDMSKKLPLLSRMFNSFCELWWVIYGYQRVITDACDWRVGDS